MLLKNAAFVLLLASTPLANSSSYPTEYTLSWSAKNEKLTYHSCGCADSCWKAELREWKTKRLKATLSCDCTKLHVVFPINSKVKELEKSCSAINESPEKFKLISDEMKSIVEDDGK